MDDFKVLSCKLCLTNVNGDNYEPIDDVTKEIFDVLLLKLDFHADIKYAMCNVCSSKLHAALNFKSTCFYTDDAITPYVDDAKSLPIDLKEIYIKEKKSEHLPDDVKICRLCMQPIESASAFQSINEEKISTIQKFIPEVIMSDRSKKILQSALKSVVIIKGDSTQVFDQRQLDDDNDEKETNILGENKKPYNVNETDFEYCESKKECTSISLVQMNDFDNITLPISAFHDITNVEKNEIVIIENLLVAADGTCVSLEKIESGKKFENEKENVAFINDNPVLFNKGMHISENEIEEECSSIDKSQERNRVEEGDTCQSINNKQEEQNNIDAVFANTTYPELTLGTSLEENNVEQENEDEEGVNKKTRKRKANTKSWKKMVAKSRRNLGLEYTNTTGKIVSERKCKVVDCSKCKLKCNTKVSEEDLQKINESYWKTGSYERQRDFICKYVKVVPIKRRRKDTAPNDTKRNNTYKYFLPNDVQVCKKTFLACLNVSEKMVQVAKKKEIKGSSLVFKDMRGKHPPKNKTSEERRQIVKNHIESFPTMSSHYCRAKSSRLYLASDLNITKMYELYLQLCEKNNISDPVTSAVYRHIFSLEYNFSFHRPKKDGCGICERYKQADNDTQLQMKTSYEQHIKNKNLAREKKSADKEKAKSDSTFKSVTFDLQSVLYTPCSEVSHFYYALKFCSYNLTVFDQATKDGYCYFWTEIDGKRGSDEIGTALYIWLKSIPETVTEISLYSDSCGGQNRNRFVAVLLLHAVRTLSVEVITQNFLETGHTDMEVDSMHSCIESNKKHQRIYTPNEWPIILRTARRRQPYHVHEMSYCDILDLKALKSSYTNKNMTTDVNGHQVNWMNIKTIQYKKSSPHSIFVKNDYNSEVYQEIQLSCPKKTRGIQNNINLKQKYSRPLPISEKKKKSLKNLCKVDVMPLRYHDFYESLPSNGSVTDRLPEPDLEEQTD